MALFVVSTAIALSAVVPVSAIGSQRRAVLNSGEQDAWDRCQDVSSGLTKGAIWMSNSASYYAMGVTLTSATATSVTVNIRGSAYGCRGVDEGPFSVYAVNIRDGGSGRLSSFSRDDLYRGAFSTRDIERYWTSTGSTITATLNVAGVATNNTTSNAFEDINVPIFRCFNTNSNNLSNPNSHPSCYSQDIIVRVMRPRASTVWNVDGTSYISKTTALGTQGTISAFPGETVRWSHRLRNAGPDNMDRNVAYSVSRTGFGNGWNTITAPSSSAQGNDGVTFVNQNAPTAPYSLYTVTAGDIGRTLCARIRWTPQSSSIATMAQSPNACATIRSDFDLIPSVKFGGQQEAVLPIGSTTTATTTMHNDGARSDVDSDYRAYQFKIPAGSTINFAGVFDQSMAGYSFAVANYTSAGNACTEWLRTRPGYNTIQCESQTFAGIGRFDPGVTTLNDGTVIDSNAYVAGDLVCRIIVTNHYNLGTATNATSRRVSYPACVTIAKKPFVKIEGNDLRVGSAQSIAANVSARVVGNTGVIDGSQRGSWVEYGIFAPSTVQTMASGSRFMADGVANSQSDWSKLTFANDGGVYGQYATGGGMGILPNVQTYFTNAALPASSMVTNTTNTAIDSYAPNRVIIDSGTVRITGDIINDPSSPVTSGVTGISQMVIIATGDIIISPNVQNIDAWLIAPNGTIETCSGAPASLTTTLCDNQLTITGPVIASHLNLRRTFGNKNEYAETVNLRADAYIWAKHLSTQTGSWQTKYTTELPPRY